MKRWVYIVLALLLLWNSWLTYDLRVNHGRPGDDGVTIINNTINGYTTDLTKMIEAAQSKMVSIHSIVDDSHNYFSGSVYEVQGDNCYILTSASLLKDNARWVVSFDNGVELEASLVGKDSLSDIGILVVQPGFNVETFTLSTQRAITQGEYGVALGSRQLDSQSGALSLGLVSLPASIVRQDEVSKWIVPIYTADVILNHECTGGVLLNLSGEMIGMLSNTITNSYEMSGMSCAVSSDEVKLVADQLIEQGTLTRGYLGVVGRNISDLMTYQKSSLNINLDITNGVLVSYLPDATNSLERNDIITNIDDVRINNTLDLESYLYTKNPGDVIYVTIIRNGAEQVIEVVLG